MLALEGRISINSSCRPRVPPAGPQPERSTRLTLWISAAPAVKRSAYRIHYLGSDLRSSPQLKARTAMYNTDSFFQVVL